MVMALTAATGGVGRAQSSGANPEAPPNVLLIAGKVIPTPVELLDLYPTLVDLAGLAQPKGLEGQSLVPLMRGPQAVTRRPASSVVLHYPAEYQNIAGAPRFAAEVEAGEKILRSTPAPKPGPAFRPQALRRMSPAAP